MPNKLKELVSKKKKRFVQEGFDLDLTYITSNIIAMGFPAQSWEGIYRNHIDDVVSFFHKKHSGHYQIYNLCNERHIDEQKFEQHSINHDYPFNDHNPPMFLQMIDCCKNINLYLAEDEQNVVAIQCKAGKGRTGVIVCACLLSQKPWLKSATDALEYYGDRRTTNGKGVTIPSQIRYIYYYDHYLRNQLYYKSISLKLVNVVLDEMPIFSGNNYEILFNIYIYNEQSKLLDVLYTSQFYEAKRDGTRTLHLSPDGDLFVKDDLKFQFVLKSKFGKKENLCHLWLNTFFIVHKPPIQSFLDGKKFNPNQTKSDWSTNRKRSPLDINDKQKLNTPAQSGHVPPSNTYKLRLQKHEIDKACKDINSKTFPSNFTITFIFEDPPTPNTNHPPQPKTRVKNSDIKRTNTNRDIQDSPIQKRDSGDINDNTDNHSESSESSSNSQD